MSDANYDPYAQRRRLLISRADIALILNLADDVHIIDMRGLREPMWMEVTVTSERFHPVSDGQEQRVTGGVVIDGRPVFEGWLDVESNQVIQKPPTPTWVEGWQAAIDWLDEQGHSDRADEMRTRLPEEQR